MRAERLCNATATLEPDADHADAGSCLAFYAFTPERYGQGFCCLPGWGPVRTDSFIDQI
jgi:hypothetical protein